MHKNYFTSEMKKNKGKVMFYSNAYKKVSNPRVPSNLISLPKSDSWQHFCVVF